MKSTNKLLSKLKIQQKPRRKTKEEFKREAWTLIKQYSKYSDDVSYKYFLHDLVVGLCKDCEYPIVNELIKNLQRLKETLKETLKQTLEEREELL